MFGYNFSEKSLNAARTRLQRRAYIIIWVSQWFYALSSSLMQGLEDG
jgi:hypothetical protein